MSITKESELVGMQEAGHVVAHTLREMIDYARPGMSTKELDAYGANMLSQFGAQSAPRLAYGFPGATCISLGREFCHGIPSKDKLLKEGDLINIDVSAVLRGFWADNGASFVLGSDQHRHQKLVEASKAVLRKAIQHIHSGVKVSAIGHLMETEAQKRGFRVIRNLGGHCIGRRLHEYPEALFNYSDPKDPRRFRKNDVVAIETFISTTSSHAIECGDGWTMVGNKGGYMAQHEHTIVVTDGTPLILTKANQIG